MKKLLLVPMLIFYLNVSAQKDPCKDIITEHQELKEIINYYSPPDNKGYVIKQITKSVTFFGIRMLISTSSYDYDARGVYFKFEDGTIIKDEDADVEREYSLSKYNYYAFFNFDEDTLEKFSTKRIVKYGIGSWEIDVPGEKWGLKIMEYIKCIKEKQ